LKVHLAFLCHSGGLLENYCERRNVHKFIEACVSLHNFIWNADNAVDENCELELSNN